MRIQKTINGVVRYFECNHSAFESIYSKQGFTACKPAQRSDEAIQEEPLAEEEQPIDENALKPIAQWTDAELRAFAKRNKMNVKTPIGILRYNIKKRLQQNESA